MLNTKIVTVPSIDSEETKIELKLIPGTQAFRFIAKLSKKLLPEVFLFLKLQSEGKFEAQEVLERVFEQVDEDFFEHAFSLLTAEANHVLPNGGSRPLTRPLVDLLFSGHAGSMYRLIAEGMVFNYGRFLADAGIKGLISP